MSCHVWCRSVLGALSEDVLGPRRRWRGPNNLSPRLLLLNNTAQPLSVFTFTPVIPFRSRRTTQDR